MNKVIIVGRLVKDPDVRYSTGENATAIASFSVAINRRFKNKEGGYDADFPRVQCFGKVAEFVERWFHKGDMIGITGRITTGKYTDKNGNTVYTTDVTAEEVEFVGAKGNGDSATTPQKKGDDDWMNVPDGAEEELPWK